MIIARKELIPSALRLRNALEKIHGEKILVTSNPRSSIYAHIFYGYHSSYAKRDEKTINNRTIINHVYRLQDNKTETTSFSNKFPEKLPIKLSSGKIIKTPEELIGLKLNSYWMPVYNNERKYIISNIGSFPSGFSGKLKRAFDNLNMNYFIEIVVGGKEKLLDICYGPNLMDYTTEEISKIAEIFPWNF